MAAAGTKKKRNTKSNARKPASKRATPAASSNSDAPKMMATKDNVSSVQILKRTRELMEDDLVISAAQARDFADSFVAAVEQALLEGQSVNLFGLVKIVPRLRTAGKRQVLKEFGNPESGKVTKRYGAAVSVKATVFKRVREALPSVQKMQKKVIKA